jgi:hypothetical protein
MGLASLGPEHSGSGRGFISGTGAPLVPKHSGIHCRLSTNSNRMLPIIPIFGRLNGSIFPEDQHQAGGKETGQTNHIERFNGTLRQRISRLVRSTLSFSKKLDNHMGAIGYFIHAYNRHYQKLTWIPETKRDYIEFISH